MYLEEDRNSPSQLMFNPNQMMTVKDYKRLQELELRVEELEILNKSLQDDLFEVRINYNKLREGVEYADPRTPVSCFKHFI